MVKRGKRGCCGKKRRKSGHVVKYLHGKPAIYEERYVLLAPISKSTFFFHYFKKLPPTFSPPNVRIQLFGTNATTKNQNITKAAERPVVKESSKYR